MTKPFKLVSVTAVACAAVLTITPDTFAGTRAVFRSLDSGSARVNVSSSATTGARANRHGADDPANHDINDDHGRRRGRDNRRGVEPGDDRGGANQPGDDNNRNRRGRGRGR